MTAQRGKSTQKHRLKDHYKDDREKNRKTAHEPADDNEIEQLRNQRQRQENDRQPSQYFRAARPAKVKIAIVDRHAQQNDFKSAAPASEPKMNEFLDHLVF